MNEPLRFLLPSGIRRFLRPVAYGLMQSVHALKIEEILREKEKHNTEILVETGTYLGDTIDSLVGKFRRIYSIELNRKLYLRAKRLFANDRSVEIIYGDSAKEIGKILSNIREPILFWLDAHYSGRGTARGADDSPVNKELAAILKHSVKKHIILIDDARFFTGSGGYPKLANLKRKIAKDYPARKFSVRNDIIHIE